ncbi:MAG: hypothetical protein IKN15_01675 [Bacteroidaceae bacterium]|nr:hypothetical protein [Bacteroidaceae bacterium]
MLFFIEIYRNELSEQKQREEEAAKCREEEALTKASEENEYKLYIKLKEKFEK